MLKLKVVLIYILYLEEIVLNFNTCDFCFVRLIIALDFFFNEKKIFVIIYDFNTYNYIV